MAKKGTISDSNHSVRNEAARLVNLLIKPGSRREEEFESIGHLDATIFSSPPPLQIAVVRECIDRIGAMRKRLGKPRQEDHRYMNLRHQDGFPTAALRVAQRLFRRKLPFTEADLVFLINRSADLEMTTIWDLPYLETLVRLAADQSNDEVLSEEFLIALGRLSSCLAWCDNARERKLRARIASLSEGPKSLPLERGEAWSDRVFDDFDSSGTRKKESWLALLSHCREAAGAAPSGQWITTARVRLKKVGQIEFVRRITAWFSFVEKPRTQRIEQWSQWVPDPNQLIVDTNANVLKGLAWCCSLFEDAEIARALTRLAISAYRKVPKIGPRAVKVGNACVYSLGAIPGTDGVAQLAILKVRVKFGTAQKGIEKALIATAERVGIPREELEEMSVPAYGLTDVGVRREEFGDCVVELAVTSRKPELKWSKADGKLLKSVPAAVKKDFADDLKDLKQAVSDIEKMLPAQAARIEQTYLQQKEWAFPIWRERYLDHPLVGTLARRLIWQLRNGKKAASAIFHDGQIVRHTDKSVDWLDDNTQVRLWHPLDEDIATITAWRDWLVRQEVRQPFKQAHREVYLLTDAERNTRSYSNRFAAHVLKQHQFNALCGARGWKNTLRLMVDDEFPPAHLALSTWKLRAEFWVEGIGGDYGTATNETGTYYYLATDQVRFYVTDAAMNTAHAGGGGYSSRGMDRDENHPLDLEQLPPLVFSEVMRDVDLFVSVASVGNDPNWSDGGPEGRYRDYWQSYSFGDLAETARTRKAVLERLVPRLTIAPRCSFSDRFLIVRGDVRSYRIHLGSGNILMEPNDQYLCIVPKQSVGKGIDNLFLPFEGDSTMSVILSKAFLLAEDTKITDPTIVSQIRR